jgi:hypothetical protein
MCKRNVEFVNHLLFHVRLIAPYGMFFSRCFRLSWVMPNQVVDLLVGGLLVVRKMVPICLLWCIWKEINDRNFEDCKRTWRNLRVLFLLYSFSLDNCIYFSFFFVRLSSFSCSFSPSS